MKQIFIEASWFDRVYSEMRTTYDMELWNACWSRTRTDLYQIIYEEIREYNYGKIIRNVYNPIHYRK